MAPKLEIVERTDGLWDWHLVGGNGEVMCGSTQGYTSTTDAHRGLRDSLLAMHELWIQNERMVVAIRDQEVTE